MRRRNDMQSVRTHQVQPYERGSAVRLSQLSKFAIGFVHVVMLHAADGAIWPTVREDAFWTVVRDNDNTPLPSDLPPLVDQRFNQLGHFFASNSGGQMQYDFAGLFDAPIRLNPDNTRPNNWRDLAHAHVLQEYGVNLTSTLQSGPGVSVHDLHLTSPDPGQGWAGTASKGGGVRLQNIGMGVFIHEMGHVFGFGHSRGFRSGGFRYEWDPVAEEYAPYTVHDNSDYLPLPFGEELKEYGHANSIMGVHGNGSFPVYMKREAGWLSGATNTVLSVGEAASEWTSDSQTFRLYAHNDLQSIETVDGQGMPLYGVEQGYDQSLTYSIEIQREIAFYDPQSNLYQLQPQSILMEYAVATSEEAPGVYTYVDAGLANSGKVRWTNVDVNPGSAWQLHENSTDPMSEHFVGSALFWVENSETDFLDYNPPPPPNPAEILPDWFTWRIVNKGETDGRNWLDLAFSLNSVPENAGDLNGDGVLDVYDVVQFRENLLSPTLAPTLGRIDRKILGDFNDDGLLNRNDWPGLEQAFLDAGLSLPPFAVSGPADVDGNGIVDIADYEVIRDNMFTGLSGWTDGDISGNGSVGFEDFRIWKRHAPSSVVALVAHVPEPASWALGLGCVLLAVGCRQLWQSNGSVD